ncbi:hypothetical protein LSP03_33820 [Lysinibacillus sphaericus]|nr:hypothetical protein LSP03_33820 [Lysinibacillus sphaericus]
MRLIFKSFPNRKWLFYIKINFYLIGAPINRISMTFTFTQGLCRGEERSDYNMYKLKI